MLTTIALLDVLTSLAKNIKAASDLQAAYGRAEEDVRASVASVSRIFANALKGAIDLSLFYQQSFELSQYIRSEEDLVYIRLLQRRDGQTADMSSMMLAVSVNKDGLVFALNMKDDLAFALNMNGRQPFSDLTTNAVAVLMLPEILPELAIGLLAQVEQVSQGLNLLQNIYSKEE